MWCSTTVSKVVSAIHVCLYVHFYCHAFMEHSCILNIGIWEISNPFSGKNNIDFAFSKVKRKSNMHMKLGCLNNGLGFGSYRLRWSENISRRLQTVYVYNIYIYNIHTHVRVCVHVCVHVHVCVRMCMCACMHAPVVEWWDCKCTGWFFLPDTAHLHHIYLKYLDSLPYLS